MIVPARNVIDAIVGRSSASDRPMYVGESATLSAITRPACSRSLSEPKPEPLDVRLVIVIAAAALIPITSAHPPSSPSTST
jgi:hypothetical protein